MGSMALTPRQLQILILYGEGKTAPQIAKELFLETGTVRVHVENLRGRLGARTMPQALVIAISRGYIEVDRYGECLVLPVTPTVVHHSMLAL